MDSYLSAVLVAEDVAREYGVMVIKSTGLEEHLPTHLVKQMCRDLKIIDPGKLVGRGPVQMDFAMKIQLQDGMGVYKQCGGVGREGQKMLITEVAAYLKLISLQGERIPRLLAYGVTEGPGVADFFYITEYYGDFNEPCADDAPELEEILKEVHRHDVMLREFGLPNVVRVEGRLMLADLTMAVFEKKTTYQRAQLQRIMGWCVQGHS